MSEETWENENLKACDWVNPAIGFGAENVTIVPPLPEYPSLEHTFANSQVYHAGGGHVAFIPHRPSSDLFTPSNGSWPTLQLPDSWTSPVAWNITKHLKAGDTYKASAENYLGKGNFTVICICENDELCGCGTEGWNDSKIFDAYQTMVEVGAAVWAVNGTATKEGLRLEAVTRARSGVADERRRRAGECQEDGVLEELEEQGYVTGGAGRRAVGWGLALVGLAVGWVV